MNWNQLLSNMVKLGPKSRHLLELLAALSLDSLDASLHLPVLYKATSFSSEKTFHQQTKGLQENGWITWDDSRLSGNWVAKISNTGKRFLNDEIDPETLWNGEWDGKWRIISFDLPSHEFKKRRHLKEWLAKLRFGHLQGSVFITPRQPKDWDVQLAKRKIDPRAVVFMRGELGETASNSEYIRRAWQFDLINHHYRTYLRFVSGSKVQDVGPEGFSEWFCQESELWRSAFNKDPFLPRSLWPKGFKSKYRGPEAFAMRKSIYRSWRERLEVE